MKQKLFQEQALQLKMNQNLLQAIQILQFSGTELVEYIQQIAKENPLIEDIHFDQAIARFKSSSNPLSIGEMNRQTLSMQDQLREQLYTLDMPKQLKPVVLFGIDSLNEDGYLDVEIDVWAQKCAVSIETVKQALTVIQSLDPPGIGARTLSECIVLQLRQKSSELELRLAQSLLDTHMNWLAEENIAAITETFSFTPEQAENVIRSIRSCHPKPGRLLIKEDPVYIIPEATIFKENGQWKISFYKWASPTIAISNAYRDLTEIGTDTKKYLNEKYGQIHFLNNAIMYRKKTLEEIIKQIVEKQYMYFEHGPVFMQSLTLKDIARELNLHISTISRAIANKYVQTEQGILPLKFFFQPGIKQEDGKQTAAHAIKQLIHEIIQLEDKTSPLSDEAIKDQLHHQYGIAIARRTVMKYRKQLNIPSSMKRK